MAGGTVRTVAAGTLTNKATYTDASGTTLAPNPIQLDSNGEPQSGNGGIWIQGSYDFYIYDANGTLLDFQGNVTSFNNTSASISPYSQDFSGNGSQTSFTLSQNFGTDPKALMIFVSSPVAGFFQQFSGTGSQTVFTLSADKGTDSTSIQVFVYNAAATDKLGYDLLPPSAYTVNGTTLTFTSAPVTGTNNIYVSQPSRQNTTGVAGYVSPSMYTLNGTALTFLSPPVAGTNNIHVTAPSTLAGAAAISAAAADASATAAANSQAAAASSAASASAFAQAKVTWTFSTTTTMAAPGTGFLRLNNASPSSVTAIAISNLCADSGNPDLSAWVATWDDAPASPRGEIFLFKDNANFAIFNITGTNVDNTGWKQITVAYVAGAGSFSNNDLLRVGFVAYGATTVTGGITALTGDGTASGSGSVPFTLSTVNSNVGSFTAANITVDAKGRITAASNGGGGAMVLIATQTVSAVSTVDFISGITSTYSHYVIEVSNLTNTGGGQVLVTLQQGGVFASSGYKYGMQSMTSSASTWTGSNSTSTSAIPSGAQPDTAQPCSIILDIFQPSLSIYPSVMLRSFGYSAGGANYFAITSGTLTTAAAVTGIRLAPNSGTVTGTFKLYGIV